MAPSAAAGLKCVYVEPSRRVKEILEEHFHFQKEECNVKHPAAVAVEEVWNVKNNFSIRSLKPVSQNRSDLLLQPQFYSRHARMKSRIRPCIINETGQALNLECLAANLQAMEMKT
ncbi:PREDICTED: uncharacterized protein C1H11orf97 [Ficedula albicollis]|uniref:uncharacterized protein C1H11orf97 n=1 Tax=Ficedula albicollis TaxID=59894 RepID=UPI0007AD79CA|nr:PREDICTED: uncharacterized protein C1H11orf97 [Ficedula albicollis]